MCSPVCQDEKFYIEKSLKVKVATIKSPERSSNHEEQLISLKDILDSEEWKENEERFFEMVIPQ